MIFNEKFEEISERLENRKKSKLNGYGFVVFELKDNQVVGKDIPVFLDKKTSQQSINENPLIKFAIKKLKYEL